MLTLYKQMLTAAGFLTMKRCNVSHDRSYDVAPDSNMSPCLPCQSHLLTDVARRPIELCAVHSLKVSKDSLVHGMKSANNKEKETARALRDALHAAAAKDVELASLKTEVSAMTKELAATKEDHAKELAAAEKRGAARAEVCLVQFSKTSKQPLPAGLQSHGHRRGLP